ncbi:MAG: T9SS type A sorting domain-containing protein [Cytophagales bacterium]|nr:T9SS type A sorting domain-containing protein [Cytophagales bacterium]
MKTKKIIRSTIVLLSLLTSTSNYIFSQNWKWAKPVLSSNYSFSNAVCNDDAGNIYITGRFQGNADFGNISITAIGVEDMFIAKYDSSGTCIWAINEGGDFKVIGKAIAADNSGNIFVTGTFEDTAFFGTDTLISAGGTDIFIAKYDTSGNLLWVLQEGSNNVTDQSRSITIDNNGNVFITGRLSSSDSTFLNTPISETSPGGQGFVAKLTQTGNCLWAIRGGLDGIVNDLSFDNSGNIYLIVRVWASGSGGSFCNTPTNISGQYDIDIVKLDSIGNCIWNVTAGSSNSEWATGIVTDGVGNSYLTGIFRDSVTFGNNYVISYGSTDIFIAKYDSNGNCIWVKNAGGTAADGDYNYGSIAFDNNGSIIIVGFYQGTANFGNNTISSSGLTNLFVASYDTSGNFDWVQTAKGNNTQAYFISVDDFGAIYVTGWYNDSSSFGNTILPKHLNSNYAFLAKIGLSGTSGIIEISDNNCKIYPNPYGYNTYLNYYCTDITYQTKLSLFIYDLIGREVKQFNNITSGKLEFRGEPLPRGMYLYKIENEKEIIGTGKLVIE